MEKKSAGYKQIEITKWFLSPNKRALELSMTPVPMIAEN